VRLLPEGQERKELYWKTPFSSGTVYFYEGKTDSVTIKFATSESAQNFKNLFLIDQNKLLLLTMKTVMLFT